MSYALKDLSENEIIDLIENNLHQSILYQGKNSEVTSDERLVTLETTFSHPYFNVCFFRESYQLESRVLDFLTHKLSGRVVSGRGTNFETVRSQLEEKGLFYAEDTIGMILDLEKINEESLSCDGLKVKRVDNLESLDLWLEPISVSYRLKDASKEYARDFYMNLGLKDNNKLIHYVAMLNEKPVASSTIFSDDGIAGLYNVCTIPELRKRGIGSFLTLQSLKNSKEIGNNVAVLQSSTMGSNIYKNMGFNEFGRQSVFIYIYNQ